MRRFTFFALSLAVAFAAQVESAKADPILSDRLLVTLTATGAVLFDGSIPEGGSESLSFSIPGAGVDQSDIALILTEPAGEPLGENPVLVPGTEIVASDVLFAGFNSLGAPALFQLVSDGDPNFSSLVTIAHNLGAPLLEETGNLQDVTGLLGSTGSFGFTVQVQSDVVPEPGTGLLLVAGLVGLAGWRRASA